MPSRPRILVTWLVATGLIVAACGGGTSKKTAKTVTPPVKPPPPTTSPPPPTYTAKQIASSALTAKDIGNNARSLPVSVPSLHDEDLPSCSNTSIRPQGRPLAEIHQFGGSDNQYTGFNYGEMVILYSTSGEATISFSDIRSKIGSCPPKRHVPAKDVNGNQVALEHDDTWKLSSDNMSGWDHVRGFEKHVEPPSSSTLNVFYDMYDFALRGNVIIASLYWQRVGPNASGETVSNRATAVLGKQLSKIG